MIRLMIYLLLVGGLAYGAMRIFSASEELPVPTATHATGTPREVYCRMPVARTAGGATQLYTSFEECMQKSELPPLKDFSPQQQQIYKQMGLGR